MMRYVNFAALALVGASASPVSAAEKQTWKSKVGESTYRVTLDRQGIVTVVSKALISGPSMMNRDDRRAAVERATGCKLIDELWSGPKLQGKLACPEGHQMPPSN